MTDDWSPPTGEHAKQPHREDATPDLPTLDEAIDPTFGVTAGELRMADTFFYEVARDAAEDPRLPDTAERAAVDDLRSRFERLKAMSPDELAAERTRLMGRDR
jgi:hypothetical protein